MSIVGDWPGVIVAVGTAVVLFAGMLSAIRDAVLIYNAERERNADPLAPISSQTRRLTALAYVLAIAGTAAWVAAVETRRSGVPLWSVPVVASATLVFLGALVFGLVYAYFPERGELRAGWSQKVWVRHTRPVTRLWARVFVASLAAASILSTVLRATHG